MTLDPTQPDDPRIGTSIADRYEVEAIAGRGGMSVVYKARDTLLGRTVAIKTLSMGAASPDDARRQQDEVAVLARLIHPSLVVLFDALDNGSGGLVLVMEYVDGRSMHEAIADGSSRTLDVARLGGELASALAYVHAQGIVHRDIKPGNVLLPVPSEHGAMAKLADFGIARLVDSNGITGTGLTVGTPAYLSPEQVTGDPAGPKSDVYGLGLVLIEAISGTRAFEGTGVEVAVARLTRNPEIPESMPPGLAAQLRAMTARDPAARPTAAEAVAAFRELSVGGSALAAESTQPQATVAFASVDTPTVALASDAPTVAAPSVAAPSFAAPSVAAPTVAFAPAAAAASAALDPTRVMPTAAPPQPPVRRRRRWIVAAAIALASLAVVVLALSLSQGTRGTPLASAPPSHSAPTNKPTPTATLAAVVYPSVGGVVGSDLAVLEHSVSAAPSLQPTVKQVADLVAANDYAGAKDALATLGEKVDAALAAGEITAEQKRTILDAASAVQKDLDALTAPPPGKGKDKGKGHSKHG